MLLQLLFTIIMSYTSDSSKAFAMSKHARKQSGLLRDARKDNVVLRKALEKALARQRALARRKAAASQPVQPESLATRFAEFTGTAGHTEDELSNTQFAHNMVETIGNSLPNTSHEIAAVFLRFATLLSSCALQTSTTGLISVITAVTAQHITGNGIKQLETMLALDVAPESGSVFGKLRNKIEQFRALKCVFAELPCYKLLARGMLLSVYWGFNPSQSFNDGTFIQNTLEKFETEVDVSHSNAAEALCEVTQFVLGIMDVAACGGNLLGYLFPATLHSRYATLLSHKEPFLAGQLTVMTADEYEDAIVLLKLELETALAQRDKPAYLNSTYTAYYANVLNLHHSVITENAACHQRAQPFGFALVGKPGSGKSYVTSHLISGIGAKCDIDVSMSKRYNATEGDKYDSGYRQDMQVYIADDVSNTRFNKNDPSTTVMSKMVKIINNVACISVQAEVTKKGKTKIQPKIVMLTSNVFDLKAHMVSHEPGSIYRRLIMGELIVKPEFATPSGKLDTKKIPAPTSENDGIQIPVQDVQLYEMVEREKGWVKENIGPKLSIQKAIAKVTAMADAHFAAQVLYLELDKKSLTAKRCFECGNPHSWCECRGGPLTVRKVKVEEKIEPESSQILCLATNFIFNDMITYLSKYELILPRRLSVHLANGVCYYLFQMLLLCTQWKVFKHIWMYVPLTLLTLYPHFVMFSEASAYRGGMLALVILYIFTIRVVLGGFGVLARLKIQHDINDRLKRGLTPVTLSIYFGAILLMVQTVKTVLVCTKMQPESLDPQSPAEVAERLGTVDPWMTPEIIKLPSEVDSMTLSQIIANVQTSNLLSLRLKSHRTCATQPMVLWSIVTQLFYRIILLRNRSIRSIKMVNVFLWLSFVTPIQFLLGLPVTLKVTGPSRGMILLFANSPLVYPLNQR